MTRTLTTCLLLAACNPPVTGDDTLATDSGTDTAAAGEFAFYTPAWQDGDTIPTEYTCDGTGGWQAQNNPELLWENPPAGTQAFAMIYVDSDLNDWNHWAFYTTNADVLGIPQATSNTGSVSSGVVELRSQDGRTGYVPNCPGSNPHTYTFTLWAVSDANALVGQSTFDGLASAASAVSLGSLSFSGEATTN